MQTDDAHHVLRILAAAFPSFPLSEDTTELYVATLATQVASVDVGLTAAQEIATSQMFFPRIAELLEACKAVAERWRTKGERPRAELEAEPALSVADNARRLADLRSSMAHVLKKA